MKRNSAITEAILSSIVPMSFCQVSHPPFKNPKSGTNNDMQEAFWIHKLNKVGEGQEWAFPRSVEKVGIPRLLPSIINC